MKFCSNFHTIRSIRSLRAISFLNIVFHEISMTPPVPTYERPQGHEAADPADLPRRQIKPVLVPGPLQQRGGGAGPVLLLLL